MRGMHCSCSAVALRGTRVYLQAARAFGASGVALVWPSQDLLADFVAQIIQQLLWTKTASLRLDPGPSQQRPKLGERHTLRGERQRSTTRAIGVGHGPQWLQRSPFAQFDIVGHRRSEMCGGQQVLPERGETAVACGADLWEKPFQVLTHDPDDLSLGHRRCTCSPDWNAARSAFAPTRQAWLAGMSSSGSHQQLDGTIADRRATMFSQDKKSPCSDRVVLVQSEHSGGYA